MFMCLKGYPKSTLAIIVMTNAQKELVKDIIHQKCSWSNYFYEPEIFTLEEYQGR